MRILRSVAAPVAGIAVYSALLFGVTWAGNALFGLSESELLNHNLATQLLWLAWNIVSIAAGGYVTAVVAPCAPVTHAVVMGTIQVLFTLGALFTAHADLTPLWLWIGVIGGTIPGAWLGARLRRPAR